MRSSLLPSEGREGGIGWESLRSFDLLRIALNSASTPHDARSMHMNLHPNSSFPEGSQQC